MVAWEVAIGRLKSSRNHSSEKFGISMWAFSMLQRYAEGRMPARFINELVLEQRRLAINPFLVSRMQGLYFFKSEHDAIAALNRWGLPHKKKYISAIDFSASALTELDSEWITNNLRRKAEKDDWMDSYWRGEIAGENTLTEVLAMGSGFVLNKELRIESYKKIYGMWPDASILLAAACCGFSQCNLNEIALVKPALLTVGNAVEGRFFIYMTEFDNNQHAIMDAIEDCKRNNECPPYRAPDNAEHFFAVPDLRHLAFRFEHPGTLTAFESVHDASYQK